MTIVRMGQRQRVDLSVFGRTKFITRQNIERLNAEYIVLKPPFCFLVHPYIGSHYRASLIGSHYRASLIQDPIFGCVALEIACS